MKEYTIASYNPATGITVEEQINALAAEGWELHSIDAHVGAVMERSVPIPGLPAVLDEIRQKIRVYTKLGVSHQNDSRTFDYYKSKIDAYAYVLHLLESL
jgi:hypothetical protein